MRQTLIVKVTEQHKDIRYILLWWSQSSTCLGEDVTRTEMTRSAEVRGKKVCYCVSEVVTVKMLMTETALQK